MKRYEGLFILNIAGKEETLKETIDQLSTVITEAGGKVETVQKMDKKPFVRVTDRNRTSGFYVNVIFESDPAVVPQLRHRFATNDEIYRVLFTQAPAPVAPKPVAEPTAK